MALHAASQRIASQARQIYLEALFRGIPTVVDNIHNAVKALSSQTGGDAAENHKRRELVLDLVKGADRWNRRMLAALQTARNALAQPAASGSTLGTKPASSGNTDFALVDDDTIEREILSSRMALALMDAANWEFSDLRSRLSSLENRDEIDSQDVLRPHVLAKYTVENWLNAGLTMVQWRLTQPLIHKEFGVLVAEAYHETNKWLLSQGVKPDVDLRPLIKRVAASTPVAAGGAGGGVGQNQVASAAGGSTKPGGLGSSGGSGSAGGHGNGSHSSQDGSSAGRGVGPGGGGAQQGFAPTAYQPRHDAAEETRLMTRNADFPKASPRYGDAILGRLNRLIAKHIPDFVRTNIAGAAPAAPAPVSPKLRAALSEAQQSLQGRLKTVPQGVGMQPTTPQNLVHELQQKKAALKEAAETPVERATIEIVALMFQAILQEDRIPAVMRVWFARLQMPVLRVAVTEPDFFATTDHPARRLIDRMGACVMGFQTSNDTGVSEALNKEIRRVVQVVEAYPDTGRRVFQAVLTEFEKFLERYFQKENDITRRGVSLAQQVEQRETLAVQYTIELRKMLEGVPVQEGLRDFLFRIWADVLATFDVKYGKADALTKSMKKAAADLIWSASAKVTREERAEVIRRLPPLLKTTRQGMAEAGISPEQQDKHIQSLNNSLAAAFTAKAESIPADRMAELTDRLQALDEVMPEDFEIDETMVLDLSGYQASGLEVVAEGGSMPTPAMLQWALELQVGSWFQLDYHGRHDNVQLVWQGMRKHLSLFVTPEGRAVLFQKQRLAAFLQAGLLVPAQEESLTIKATRVAMAKLDADPERLQ